MQLIGATNPLVMHHIYTGAYLRGALGQPPLGAKGTLGDWKVPSAPSLGRRRRLRRLEGPKGALPSVPDALLGSGIALAPDAIPGHSVPGALLPSVISALVVPGALQAPRGP